MESLADQGDKRAKRVLSRVRDLSFELSGAQLGITVTSLIIGFVAEDTIAKLIGPLLERLGISSLGVAVAMSLVLATTIQMVFGELFPKNVAIARPYPTVVRVGLPMATVNRLLRPVIVFLNAAADWTVRRFGIEPRSELTGLRSLQELEMIIRASSDDGVLDDNETSLLTRAIGFGDRDAAEAMVPRVSVVGISADASVLDLRRLSIETGHSRFPVYQGDLDRIEGIAHVKDTFGVHPADRATTPVSHIAVDARIVPESVRLDTLLVELQADRRSMAVVADEYGGTAGIVTVEDIVEEILGEIEDEYDTPQTADDGNLISGSLHRREVAERTGFEWEEGPFETFSGFVTDRLERFPEVGDVVVEGAYRIEVVAVNDHVAESLTVRRTESDDEEAS